MEVFERKTSSGASLTFSMVIDEFLERDAAIRVLRLDRDGAGGYGFEIEPLLDVQRCAFDLEECRPDCS